MQLVAQIFSYPAHEEVTSTDEWDKNPKTWDAGLSEQTEIFSSFKYEQRKYVQETDHGVGGGGEGGN